MQQDDQNTFKYHSMTHPTQKLQLFADKNYNKKGNILKSLNLIRDGINFIVPSFWYQELIDINQNTINIEEIQFPPFQFMIKFLRLHALQNPSQSPFQINQRYSALSTSFLADLLQQSNFNESKTIKFSKLNDTRECSEIQWSLVNPYVWNLIDNRIQLTNLNRHQRNREVQQKEIELNEKADFEQLPRLSVMVRKQFIIQNSQNRTKQKTNKKDSQSIQITYKNKKYQVKKQDLQKQVTNQLKELSQQQTNLLLIIDQTISNSLELKKITVSGFFSQNMGFKQLIKSLMQIYTKSREQVSDKFYIYDHKGHKITNKINTVFGLNQLTKQKQIIISTLPIQSISERKIGLKNNLKSLLSSIQNEQNEQNQMNQQSLLESQLNLQSNQNLKEIYMSLNKKAKQIEFTKLKQSILNIGSQSQQNPVKQQARSGFKPFNKPFNQTGLQKSNYNIQIQASSNYIDTQNALNQGQNQDDFRLIQSLTTNMDTPIQQQSQSQRPSSSYQNKRLHRHGSYSRQQRKKKSQSYLQKKKKNNVILKDNSSNNKEKNHSSSERRKRVKHSLFQSLASLEKQDETLQFLLKNMRVVSRDIIYAPESELIKHPYLKQKIVSEGQDENSQHQNKSQKGNNKWDLNQKKNNQSQQKIKQNQQMTASLQQIASMIEQRYQPHLTQKQSLDQLQKMQLYQQYENEALMKKDNEQIKTIVDNSQGPYSQIEKHNVRQRYRLSEKKIAKNQMEIDVANDDFNSFTEGMVNYLDENQETL